jgi:hypothetical protein
LVEQTAKPDSAPRTYTSTSAPCEPISP